MVSLSCPPSSLIGHCLGTLLNTGLIFWHKRSPLHLVPECPPKSSLIRSFCLDLIHFRLNIKFTTNDPIRHRKRRPIFYSLRDSLVTRLRLSFFVHLPLLSSRLIFLNAAAPHRPVRLSLTLRATTTFLLARNFLFFFFNWSLSRFRIIFHVCCCCC